MIFISNLVSFALGLVSAFLIDRYRDRNNARRELSREVYVPLHVEITAHILDHVERHIRPGCQDHTWREIKAKGLAKLIDSELRERIEAFYAIVLPRFERAWQACQHGMNGYRQRWDELYGTPPGGTKQVDIDWFSFLTESRCRPPELKLTEGDALRVFNRSITTLRFASWMPAQQFLNERWKEVNHDPVIIEYRQSHNLIVKESKLLTESLQEKICV